MRKDERRQAEAEKSGSRLEQDLGPKRILPRSAGSSSGSTASAQVVQRSTAGRLSLRSQLV